MASYLTIVQARMGSTRLPGKVMLELCSKPVIWHVVERLKLSKNTDKIIVATSLESSNDPLCNYLKETGIDFFRGSEQDVLDRFYHASKQYPSDAVVRATADNPLVDPVIMDETIAFFEKGNFRYVKSEGFPSGIGIEVFSTEMLDEAHGMAHNNYEREHVTPYMYSVQQSHGSYGSTVPADQYRLTMDTPKDYELMQDIYKHLYHGFHSFFMEDILKYLNNREPA